MLRKTAKYSLYFFEAGDVYSAKIDAQRFATIENQLDAALSLTGGGILSGWGIIQTLDQVGTRDITIQPGFGIVPFTIDEIDSTTGKTTKKQHFLGCRTNSPIIITNIGLNRRNVIYIELNRQILNLIQSNDDAIVDISEETINIVVRPIAGDPAGSGPFRTTTATDDAGNTNRTSGPNPGFSYNEYPIYYRKIDGKAFESDNNKVVVYVNDKPFYGGYFISGSQGNVLGFNNPLHPEDNVTVRLDPAYSLVIGEVLTDSSRVVEINNDVKEFAKEKSANNILAKALLDHIHDNLEDNPDKILLTTKTAKINSNSSLDNQTYTFNKPNESVYGFEFSSGKYTPEVYVNGFLSTEQVVITETSAIITVKFSSKLESVDVVQIVLLLNEDQTQIKNVLEISGSNPSAQKVNFEISGEKINSEQLDPIKIPRLSHIGRSKEIFRPANDPNSSREYVHRSEFFTYGSEFFPVHKNKTNARNAKKLFLEQKSTDSAASIHSCASNGFLYMLAETPMFTLPEDFIGGWSSIVIGDSESNEYDAPFDILPIKNPINTTDNNWDRLFYVGNRFITQNEWASTSNPTLEEIVNLSSDNNPSYHNTTLTDLKGLEILDSCGGKSPLNMERTAFILMDNKVFFYDYIIDRSKYFWLDMTSSALWTGNATSLSSIDILGSTILFVGTDNGEVWCNILASSNVINNIKSGSTYISQGNISFKPTVIWENNSYSYGYGLGESPSYFDIFNIRGNNFGYGNVGYDFGYEEKLPIKAGDDLLFITANLSERKRVATASDSSLVLINGVSGTFKGESGDLANSLILLDWFKISDGLVGDVKKVDFDNEKLIFLTDSNIYYSENISSLEDLFFIESYDLIDSSIPYSSLNDFGILDDCLIVASENGIYKGEWDGLAYTWSVSQNSEIATSINNMLYPAYSIKVDGNDVYSCGKYGIFKSVDCGDSWRNTVQIIGLPEDLTSAFTLEKDLLKIVSTDSSLNRIYMIQSGTPYGYGYGYGYGEGADYFDVFGLDSSTYGYGFDPFESDFANDYGYGFGFELLNAISAINNNDWIYFDENSGSIYESIPLKIVNSGIGDNDLFFVEVELANADKADFNEIIENQSFSIYRKKEPLGLIDGIPQDSRYESTDVIEYTVDYNRQSIAFEENTDVDKTITIASEYKAFEPIVLDILDLTIDEVKVNGIEVTPEERTIASENYIVLTDSMNIDDIVKATIKGLYIEDVGEFTHEELEDAFSTEELGMPYKFEGIRTSNFLSALMAIQHAFPRISDSVLLTQIDSSISSVSTDFISDTSKNYMPNSLIGRKIILDYLNSDVDYTVKSNTENTITLLRINTFEDFTDLADGETSTFTFRVGAVSGEVDVYLNGVLQTLTTDYTYETLDGEVVAIDFVDIPLSGSRVIVSYVSTEDYVDFSDIAEAGTTYRIVGEEISPFKDLNKTFVSMYDDASDLDSEFSFIENSIVIKNDDKGIVTQANFYVYYNSLDQYIYAGTNKGVWKREKDISIYCKTSELISTIDATGPIPVPNSVHGFYVQYDKESEEWTVTWGLGVNNNDINDNITEIGITAIENNPNDNNMILAGSANALYRTIDGGVNWSVVWDFTQDERVLANPIPRQIVFDDKNSWIVNIVNQSGLFRSFDYGNIFEKISSYDIENRGIDASKSFAYQVDSTDSRGIFYYGENSLQIKKSKDSSPFGEKFSDLIKTRSKDILGIDLGNLSINKIQNRFDDVNTLFISSDIYGLMKSTVCGNDVQISSDKFKEYYVNFTNELIDEFNNPNSETNNTGAFHFVDDPDVADQIVGRYRIFVDKLRNRTYILTKVEQDKKVPTLGEFVGKFITLEVENSKNKIFRIIEHYDRGILPSGGSIIDNRGNDISSHIVEFVLEGQYPFLYDPDDLDGNTVVDYDYYWYGDSPFSTADAKNPQILQSGFRIPIFSQSNGSVFNPTIYKGNLFEINSIGLSCEASLSDTFSGAEDENIISIFYARFDETGEEPPSEFLITDALVGYYIGDIQSETKYRITKSKAKTLDSDEEALFYSIIFVKILPVDSNSFNANGFDDPIKIWNKNGSNGNASPTGLNSQLALFNPGEISAITGDTITLAVGRLPEISTSGYDLTGYLLYPRSGSDISFKITANTENTITVDSSSLTSIGIVGDFIRIGGKIQSEKVKDFIIDPSDNDKIYAAGKDNPYMSLDGGKTWKLIDDGLLTNTLTGESVIEFEKVKVIDGTLYACALDYAPSVGGGIYKFSGSSWSRVGGESGDGLSSHSINNFCGFEDGGTVTIYCGTVDDGVYRGIDSGSGFSWSRMVLPEYKTTAIETIQKENGDLERLYIGTDGKGIFRKDSLSYDSWISTYNNILKDIEIKSRIWRPWDISNSGDDIIIKSLFSGIRKVLTNYGFFEVSNYFQIEYSPTLGDGITDTENFDWLAGTDKYEDDKEIPQILSLDQSNSTYITEFIDRTITSVDSPSSHKLSKFISGIKGSGKKSESLGIGSELRGFGKDTNSLGIEKVNVSGKQSSVYEEPFSHLPDRQSITVIKEIESGRVIIGTDRSGVWRTKSGDGRNFILPFNENPSSSFNSITFGYDFDSTKLGRFKATVEGDFPNSTYAARVLAADPSGEIGFIDNGSLFNGATTSARFFRAEKIFTYNVDSPEDIFSDIDLINGAVIGGYFIMANNIKEDTGIIGDRIVLEIVNCIRESDTRYKLYLSAGSVQQEIPIENISYGPWDDLEDEIESPSGTYTKICIIDFESYEDISGDLPKLNIKNSRGIYESGVFVRDMEVVGSTAAIACGIGGVFISKDINNIELNNISWFGLGLPSEGLDVTSILITEGSAVYGFGYGYGEGLDYFDVFDFDGALYGSGDGTFEYDYSYAYGYGVGSEYKLNIYISTWGNGVWVYKDGYWSGDSFVGGTWTQIDTDGLGHNNVWTIFKSEDNTLYCGTEHGGVYTCNLNLGSPLWTREIDNIVRSKIFVWKTEGVPVLKSTGLDYSNSDKLLSYSFGGGIMRSTDRGDSWSQVISGLNNLYIQDISICPDDENVVYAATAGGGVYKTTNAFDGNCDWVKTSELELPSTLNIDQVEVGTDPDILYIKARLNDLSYKDLPLELKALAEFASPPVFENGAWTGSLKSSYFNGSNFVPLQPYLNGNRKAIIYRSEDGGSSWQSAYDTDPDLDTDYDFSSAVFGLTITPGEEDRIQFLYKSSLTSNNNNLGTVNRFLFVTIDAGDVESEIAFPFDSYPNLKLFNQKSEAYISINPNDTDNIYIALQGSVGENRLIPPIYKSLDGGASWEYSSGNFTSSEGFNNKIQISTKTPSNITGSLLEASSSFTINGSTTDIAKNTALFDEAKAYYLQNFNKTIVANFTESSDPYSDSLFLTYRDEPVVSENIRYPRPFYLNGANLQLNTNQPLTLQIVGGGNGTYLPKITKDIGVEGNPQFATFILEETYKANVISSSTNVCKLSNLTSLKIDYSSLDSTSILRKENSLIGLDLTISGNVAKIAIHRALYGSISDGEPSKIELVVIGDFGDDFAAGTSITISLDSPIYSNYDNDLMMSVNGGISWKKIGKDSFSLATDNIKGAVNNGVLPETTPETVRSTYILRDEGEYSIIYRGDVIDERYSDGLSSSIVWTQIGSSSYFKASKTMEDGLSFDKDNNKLYISEIDRISVINLSVSEDIETVFSNLNISIPISISEANPTHMAFVANGFIYLTKDSFSTNSVEALPSGISQNSIRKIILSKNSLFPDEILLCVDGGQEFTQASNGVVSISSVGSENLIILSSISNLTNPFSGFNGRSLIFEKDGSSLIYASRILNAASNTMYVLNTLTSTVVSFEYSQITNRTLMTCKGPVSNISDYIGNSFSLKSRQDSDNFFLGRIEDVQNITNIRFDIIVSGDLRTLFTENNIDFNTRFPIYTIGRISDFLGSTFSGKVSSSRAATQTEQNGLWYSNTFGANFSRIEAIRIGGLDDKCGCVDANLYENGAISAITTSGGIFRILTNNSYLPSTNINRVLALSDGSVMALTDNGLSIVEGDDIITFKNFFFNDFKHVVDVEADQFYLFDSDNNSFILNGIPDSFFGNETPVPGQLSFGNVNKVFKDSLDVIWVATEGLGVYVVYGTEIYNFKLENSTLPSNSIRDIEQDSRGNIWLACSSGGVATGNYGDDVNNVSSISWSSFDSGIGFTGVSGLTGEINAVKERTKLNIVSNGTISPAQVSLLWVNDSSIFPQTIILRSRENIAPVLANGDSIAFSPIRDTVLSIVSTTNDSSQNIWRITGNTNIDYGTNNVIGKYIIPDTRNSDNSFEIIGNSLNSFDILRTSPTAPSVGNFIVASKIDSSFIIYSGDGSDVNFEFVDNNVINNGIYYYFMFFYNSSNLIYKLSDGGQAIISEDSINTDINIDIICGGEGGIFRFTPNGSQKFEFIASFGDDNTVTDIFFDTSNVGWISANNKLVEFNSPNFTTEYTIENVFEGKSEDISSAMIVNNVVERLDGKIIIATNVGLSIKTETEFKSFISNDEGLVYRNDDNSIKFDSWRVSKALESNAKKSNFLKSNSNEETFLIVDRNVYYTNNSGNSWDLNNNVLENSINEDIQFSHEIRDENDEIIDYVFIGDRAIYSSGDSSFDNVILENLPTNINAIQSFSAGDIWLSENATDDRLIIGLCNNNIIEDERELAIIDFTTIGDFTLPLVFITGSDGLSIQSTYCFEELIDGSDNFIFAGCKDSIIFKKNSEAWKILETGIYENNTFVYTSIVGRVDSESIEHEKVIYAKRSSIYAEFTPLEILSIKVDSILENKVTKYSLNGSLAGVVRTNGILSYRNQIEKVDRNGFDAYSPQAVQSDIYNGHYGGLEFLNSSRILAIGGFANTLMIVPFTAENSTDLFKIPTGVFSGLRSHYEGAFFQTGYPTTYNGFYFPYEINEDSLNHNTGFISFSSGLSNKTEANFLTKNKNSWSVSFNNNDGYASYLAYGQNSQNKNRKFDFAETENTSYLMKTRDGGQFWAPISYDNDIYPKASISKYIYDNDNVNNITISTINGIYDGISYNSGVFFSSDGGVNWTNVTDSLPKVPVKEIELIDSKIYAGSLGFGVYETSYSSIEALNPSWSEFNSRFKTRNGINIGLWEVTSIDEDPINTGRIIIGTEKQGVLESLDNGVSWTFDDNGIPTGHITKVKTLNTNPFIVMSGVKDDGLYIKNSETGKYEKKTNGLPENYDVVDILIDVTFTDIFNGVYIKNTSNENIIVLRSDLIPPTTAPSSNVVYSVGDEIDNSKIIYAGTEDFSTLPLEDRNGTLRSGIPYYYRIYIVESDGSYSELNTINGTSSSIESLAITDNSSFRLANPFPTSGSGLEGRLVNPATTTTSSRLFEIESNTGSELTLKRDPFDTINIGDATRNGLITGRQSYIVYSTFVVYPTRINPIYIVAKNLLDDVSKVYYSGDNGETWEEKTEGITSNNINSITQEKLNNDARLFLQETVLYAATNDGVFTTSDNGVSWTEISNSSGVAFLPNTKEYRKILIDSEDCQIIYAATKDGLIYRTVNEGETWELLINTSENINVSELISFFTNYIYVGTNDNGIIRIENSIRDRIDLKVIADGNITSFDIDYFEIGDSINTETNSIMASTLAKNDSISDNKEQVRFKTKDTVNNIEFYIKRNGIAFDITDMFIGSQEDNPQTNPFILQVPGIKDDPTVINKIISLDDGLLYVASNKGVYISDDFGEKWDKIKNSALPDTVFDIGLIRNNELALATKSGVWASKESRNTFGIAESSGKIIRTIFESTKGNVRNFLRGGENGLRISIENSKSIIVYSGNAEDVSLKFSWGDIFEEKDGNWSSNTQKIISDKILATTRPGSTVLSEFDGWDYALIVRKGPFSTYEKATKAGENNDIFSPYTQVVYPNTISAEFGINESAIFSASSDIKASLEEIRDVNLEGDNSTGISFNPKRFMADGSIIVGVLPNRKRFGLDFPYDFDKGSTPDTPIIDNVQPITEESSRLTAGLYDNYADLDVVYPDGYGRCPAIISDMFYLYRVYPYILVPEPFAVSTDNENFPTLPVYRPSIGDIPDVYGYNLEINKFEGATTILCGITIGENNWIVGTDAGAFYSTQAGRDVNSAENSDIIGSNFKVSALIKTSEGIVLAAVSSNDSIYLAKSVDIPLGRNWEILTNTILDFESANVHRIYNMSEDGNNIIHMSTNAGIFRMESDGSNLVLSGAVGDLEPLTNGAILGQEIYIE